MPFLASDILHLLEVYQGIISARPLEMGNGEFLRSLLASSGRLAVALAEVPRNSGLQPAEREALSALLAGQTPANAKEVSGKVLAVLAEVKGRDGAKSRATPLYLRGPLPALGRDYERVTVIFGPALGLGDQIAFLQFLRRLTEHCPHSSLTIFTLYPNLWRQFFPHARELHYRGRPLRPFDRLTRNRDGAATGKELVLVADFEGFNFHTKVIPRRPGRDVLEVALGRRTAWLSRGGSAWVRFEEFFSASLPNNYHLLGDIAGRLFPEAAEGLPWQPHRVKRAGGHRGKTIFLNPFSSKKIPLRPADWHRLLVRLRSELPRDFDFRVVVYPGLDSSTRDYAVEICRLAAEGRRPIPASLLGAGASEVTPFGALLSLTAALEGVDLCVTVDTFTAHLVPLFAVPTVVITLGENRMFWVPGRWSFHCLLDAFDRVPAVLAARLLLTRSRPERKRREFREAADRLLACSEGAGEDGRPAQIAEEIQGALAETLQHSEPTFPYLAQARRWLLLWSRLALAARREPVEAEGLRPYVLQWRESEFLKVLALTVEGVGEEGEALPPQAEAEAARGVQQFEAPHSDGPGGEQSSNQPAR